MQGNKSGVGIQTYLAVKDIDAYHATITKKGVKATPPKNQFYGLREIHVQDPDGFRFVFYTLIKMASCQSCGMPLTDAKPGEMYCHYCTGRARQAEAVRDRARGHDHRLLHGRCRRCRATRPRRPRRSISARMPAWAGRKQTAREGRQPLIDVT
jgi:hypothetical protein